MSLKGSDVGGPQAVRSGSSVSDTAVAIVKVVPTAYNSRLPAAPDQWRVIAERKKTPPRVQVICRVET